MRRYRFLIAAFIAAGLLISLVPAYAVGSGQGGSGCTKICAHVPRDGGMEVYCWSMAQGDMVTCEVVQWCWKSLGSPTVCQEPDCDGAVCLVV